jgi:hypothetical protein
VFDEMTANNLKNSLVNESDTSSGVCGGCENRVEAETKKYRYTVELGARARGVQLLELTDDEKEELLGDYPYPLGVLYYQNGEGYDMNRDEILLDYDSDMGEQYYDTYLLKLVDTCWWQNLQESYD